MSGELYKGDVQIDVLDATFQRTGYSGPINATSVAIEPQDPEEKTRPGTGTDNYGQALDTVLIPKPQKITVSWDEMPPELKALGLGGTVEDFSQAAVTDAPVTVKARLDKWVDLGYRNIAAGGVGHATMAEGTDFLVEPVRGQVKFLTSGAAVEGATVALTVTASAVTAKRIKGATRPTLNIDVLLSGINQATGERGTLHVHRATVAPSGAVDPMSGEYTSLTLKGTLVTPPGKTSPYDWDGPEEHA